MSVTALAAVLVLASFGALSIASLALSRVIWTRPAAAVADPRILFLRAICPTIVPALVAIVLVLPAFLIYEPRRQEEWPGVVLVALALGGAARLIVVISRALQAVRASQLLVREWARHATPLPIAPWGVPASKIDAGFPVVAVAGVLASHVFVDRRVLEACPDAELAMIAAHERAHIASHDNLRRLLIAACTGHDSEVSAAWSVAAERQADERAVQSPVAAADLAGALVRVARMAPTPVLPIAAISSIHDGGSLEARVHRLLTFEPANRGATPTWPAVLGTGATTLGLIATTPLLRVLHSGLEIVVQRLP